MTRARPAAADPSRGTPGQWCLCDATLKVLTPTTDLEALTVPQFASYIPTDHNSRIFMVTGALTGITALSEVYHP